MAEKPKRKIEFAKFDRVVSLPLLPELVDAVESYLATPQQVHDGFDSLPTYGYSATIRPNAEGGMTASAQQMLPNSPNKGLMIYANAPDVLGAKAVLLAKLGFLGITTEWASKLSTVTRLDYS